MLTKDEFKYGFYDNIVTDCAVRSKDFFALSARSEEKSDEHDLTGEWDVTKYGCRLYLNKPEGKRIGKATLRGWGRMYCTASTLPAGLFIYVSAEGFVYAVGANTKKSENISDAWVNKQALPDYQGGGPGYFGVWRAKMLFGHAWVCGPRGNVARRVGEDKWEYRGNPFPDTMDIYELDNQMLMDIDGFSENDMYAVGGPGRVWHYDGQTWSQVAFPTNMHLYTVCCGADGEVYIGAQSGTVFKGRGSRWRQIAAGGLATPFNDMVWFQDRVWATSDNSIWTISNDSMEQPLIPDEVIACAGSMSVGDGVLLVAGQGGAAFHNGVLWQSLFLQYEMTQEVDHP